MKKVKIYTIEHPITNEVKYIGKTVQILKHRLSRHISKAKKAKSTPLDCWILSLLKKDLKPVITLLENVNSNDWQFWEIFWISQFKSWGFNIKNSTPGGEGMYVGFKHSDSTKKKISDKLKGSNHPAYGKKNSSEVRLKISIANKGRKSKRKEKTYFQIYDKNKAEKLIKEKHKPVLQLTKDNIEIKKWNSMKDASITLDIHLSNISYASRGIRNTAGGFKWKII